MSLSRTALRGIRSAAFQRSPLIGRSHFTYAPIAQSKASTIIRTEFQVRNFSSKVSYSLFVLIGGFIFNVECIVPWIS